MYEFLVYAIFLCIQDDIKDVINFFGVFFIECNGSATKATFDDTGVVINEKTRVFMVSMTFAWIDEAFEAFWYGLVSIIIFDNGPVGVNRQIKNFISFFVGFIIFVNGGYDCGMCVFFVFD